jgi:carbon storage regulator
MLVIRRRAGEVVLIGDGVAVTVIEVAGSRVKLGIQAPADVPILRKEIQLAAQQNMAAAEGVTAASVRRLLAALGGHTQASKDGRSGARANCPELGEGAHLPAGPSPG